MTPSRADRRPFPADPADRFHRRTRHELTQRVIRKFVDTGTVGRIVIVSSMGGMLTVSGPGAYCACKHALEAIAATLRDELAPTGITVQTINPGPYDTGFNDHMADSTYRWHGDAVDFTREDDIKADFAQIMAGQFDPQDMPERSDRRERGGPGGIAHPVRSRHRRDAPAPGSQRPDGRAGSVRVEADRPTARPAGGEPNSATRTSSWARGSSTDGRAVIR
ncbi:SDR family NAD(P)-dependent oxidoreductase [Streptomyces sp. NPDC059697]|uniref:SDR family NAD(P)-dependent oxidoreductase n=1 Tax=Streptomyces sp. NPDC059697 TaxID=3346912 RepID=UPI0036D02555